jgi:hypothetical protein
MSNKPPTLVLARNVLPIRSKVVFVIVGVHVGSCDFVSAAD